MNRRNGSDGGDRAGDGEAEFSLEEHEDRLIWIFGSSRSGSTWLLRMLSELECVVPVDDPHLGHHLGVWRPIPLAWAASEDPPPLATLLELKSDEPGYFFADRFRESWRQPLRELIQSRFEAQAEEGPSGVGRRAIVVKEPGSHAAPFLTELFPRSRMIWLLRDGRDVVDSWLDAYRDGSWAISGGAFPVSDEGRIPLIRWLAAVWVYRSRAVKRAYESLGPSQRVMIRYEDLRERTAEALAAIAGALGLDRDGLADIAARHSFERLPSEERGERREKRSARPGAWRENLTEREQLVMHEALGDALQEFGYETAPRPVGVS
jgi:Sulfotransferase family